MANAIGVSLDTSVVRAVMRVASSYTVAEFAWDALRPEEVVDGLRAKFGAASKVSIAIGLGFLEVARPELPPLPPADARRVLLRDADRYFPLEGSAAVSLPQAGSVAFAVNAARLQAWVAAFANWAPVHAIFAAPDVIAYALHEKNAGAQTYAVDAAVRETGTIKVQNGRVVEARRLPTPSTKSSPNDARTVGDNVFGVGGQFAAAIGALLCVDSDTQLMLLDTTLERSLNAVRQQRAWRSYAYMAFALVGLVASFNSSRERTLAATQAYADSLEKVSAPGIAAQARLLRSQHELSTLAARSGSAGDALQVLAALSKALPSDAFVQRIEWDGKEWRLEGSTDQAAAIVQKLDAQAGLSNVRVLNASMRFRDGNRTRESFSVAFQTKGADSVVR